MYALIIKCIRITNDIVEFEIKDFFDQKKGVLKFDVKGFNVSLIEDIKMEIDPKFDTIALIYACFVCKIDLTKNHNLKWEGFDLNINDRNLIFKKGSSIIYGHSFMSIIWDYKEILNKKLIQEGDK